MKIDNYIQSLFKSNIDQAKREFKDYWYSDGNIEGVIIEIIHGRYNIICTDGETRLI